MEPVPREESTSLLEGRGTYVAFFRSWEMERGALAGCSRMIVATYNIHRCIGTDGRHAPSRIAEVLAELEVDVVALQEVDVHLESGVDQFEFLARTTGMTAIAGPTLESGSRRYGNALLTRAAVSDVTRIELSAPGREPRGALEAVVASDSGPLRILATHLGLDRRERRAQARQLARRLAEHDDGTPVVVLGDLNSVSGLSLAPLRAWMAGRPPSLRTFPARRALLPLDRIWVKPRALLDDVRVHRSRLARVASDHLPLRARLRRDA